MPTTNFDSSLLTKYRQAKANYTFAQSIPVGQYSVRTLTGGNPSQELIIEKPVGASQCTCPFANRNGCTCTATNTN